MAKQLKTLQKENARLKKLVAEQALDREILKQASRGNWQALNVDDEPWSRCVAVWGRRTFPSAGLARCWANRRALSATVRGSVPMSEAC